MRAISPSGRRQQPRGSGCRAREAAGIIWAAFCLWWGPTAPAHAADWPTYRHDRLRTAITSEGLELPLERIWTFRARSSRLAPKPKAHPLHEATPEYTRHTLPITAVGDSLFFSSAADGRTVCLDAAKGKVRWEFTAGAGMNHTPNYWQGRIYVGSEDGHAYCIDARTGALVWKHKAAPADRWFLSYEYPTSAWPVRTDVLVDKGTAYFGAGVFPHDGTFLYAVDARTGQRIWRNGVYSETGNQFSLTPSGHLYVTRHSLYVPMDLKAYRWVTLFAFNRANGKHNPWGGDDPERPEHKLEGYFLPLHGVLRDGVRYLGHEAWKADDKGKQTERIWSVPMPGRWTDVVSVQGMDVTRGAPVKYDPDLSSIVYAGGVVYHTALDVDPQKGTGGGVYARDPKDGRELWSAEIAERPNQVIVANGRLFVATRGGTIYGFAPKGSTQYGVIDEPVEPEPFKDAKALAPAAEAIVRQTGVRDGYAVVLDCESGALAYELARRTNLRVCAVFRDAAKAAAARRAYSRANLHVSRILVWHREPGTKLPYPAYFADLIVSESAAVGRAPPHDLEALNRLLKPIRGVALIGGKQSDEALRTWVAATGQPDWQIVTDNGSRWARRVRPRLKDAGGWTHLYGDAGNTGCSGDGALKPPLGVVWYGAPILKSRRMMGASPALIVDGIMVSSKMKWLEGYDQYTGRLLWRHPLTGYPGHGHLAAGPGNIFMISTAGKVVRIDLLTGRRVRDYLSPVEGNPNWGWIAASDDGKTLYGTGNGSLFALDADTGATRWVCGSAKDPGGIVVPGANVIAMSDGRIYFVLGAADDALRKQAVAEMRAWLATQSKALREEFEGQAAKRDVRTLVAVDAETGKVLYRHGVDVTHCGGRNLRPVRYGTKKHYNPGLGMCLVAHRGVVLIGSYGGADKYWVQWTPGNYRSRALTAHDGATGKLLWNIFANYRGRPVVVDDTVHAEPWGYNLRTGKPKTRTHPITGEAARWAWCRYDKQCGIFCASKHFLFGRSKGIGYHDLLTDQGLYTFWHSRPSCWFDTVSGGGLMIKPPQAIACRCAWSMPFTVAMGRVPTPPAVPQRFAQPGPSVPVKHLHLDFGATGDRRDSEGNLWLTFERPGRHLEPMLQLDGQLTFYEGGGAVRRSAVYTPVENAAVPFVFATSARGLRRCVIPVTTPRDGSGIYRVRLGFSALPGDRPGRRVFDVALNGRTVLEDFDIIKETGKADRAAWKEFVLSLDGDLELELLAKSEEPTTDQMPLINGLQVLRKEMTTLGLDVPGYVLLNRSKPEETVTVALANLRDEPFKGKLSFGPPAGIEVAAPDGGAVAIRPGARTSLAVRIRANDKAQAGIHKVVVRLVAVGGRVEAERKLAIEWLGPLERRVITAAQSFCLRAEQLKWRWPDQWRVLLSVSRGAKAAGDERAAVSYLLFGVPRDIGSIRRARVRLHRSPHWRELFLPAMKRRLPAKRAWGTVARLDGAWPDSRKVKYSDRPKGATARAPLVPLIPGSDIIEGRVDGPLEGGKQLGLVVEPTGLIGAMYWGRGNGDREGCRPQLLLDCEPN